MWKQIEFLKVVSEGVKDFSHVVDTVQGALEKAEEHIILKNWAPSRENKFDHNLNSQYDLNEKKEDNSGNISGNEENEEATDRQSHTSTKDSTLCLEQTVIESCHESLSTKAPEAILYPRIIAGSLEPAKNHFTTADDPKLDPSKELISTPEKADRSDKNDTINGFCETSSFTLQSDENNNGIDIVAGNQQGDTRNGELKEEIDVVGSGNKNDEATTLLKNENNLGKEKHDATFGLTSGSPFCNSEDYLPQSPTAELSKALYDKQSMLSVEDSIVDSALDASDRAKNDQLTLALMNEDKMKVFICPPLKSPLETSYESKKVSFSGSDWSIDQSSESIVNGDEINDARKRESNHQGLDDSFILESLVDGDKESKKGLEDMDLVSLEETQVRKVIEADLSISNTDDRKSDEERVLIISKDSIKLDHFTGHSNYQSQVVNSFLSIPILPRDLEAQCKSVHDNEPDGSFGSGCYSPCGVESLDATMFVTDVNKECVVEREMKEGKTLAVDEAEKHLISETVIKASSLEFVSNVSVKDNKSSVINISTSSNSPLSMHQSSSSLIGGLPVYGLGSMTNFMSTVVSGFSEAAGDLASVAKSSRSAARAAATAAASIIIVSENKNEKDSVISGNIRDTSAVKASKPNESITAVNSRESCADDKRSDSSAGIGLQNHNIRNEDGTVYDNFRGRTTMDSNIHRVDNDKNHDDNSDTNVLSLSLISTATSKDKSSQPPFLSSFNSPSKTNNDMNSRSSDHFSPATHVYQKKDLSSALPSSSSHQLELQLHQQKEAYEQLMQAYGDMKSILSRSMTECEKLSMEVLRLSNLESTQRRAIDEYRSQIPIFKAEIEEQKRKVEHYRVKVEEQKSVLEERQRRLDDQSLKDTRLQRLLNEVKNELEIERTNHFKVQDELQALKKHQAVQQDDIEALEALRLEVAKAVKQAAAAVAAREEAETRIAAAMEQVALTEAARDEADRKRREAEATARAAAAAAELDRHEAVALQGRSESLQKETERRSILFKEAVRAATSHALKVMEAEREEATAHLRAAKSKIATLEQRLFEAETLTAEMRHEMEERTREAARANELAATAMAAAERAAVHEEEAQAAETAAEAAMRNAEEEVKVLRSQLEACQEKAAAALAVAADAESLLREERQERAITAEALAIEARSAAEREAAATTALVEAEALNQKELELAKEVIGRLQADLSETREELVVVTRARVEALARNSITTSTAITNSSNSGPAGSLASLFQLPTRDDVMAGLGLEVWKDDRLKWRSENETSDVENTRLNVNAEGNNFHPTSSLTASTSLLGGRGGGGRGGIDAAISSLLATFTETTPGSSSATQRGRISTRMWLLLAYLFILHLFVMISYNHKSDLPSLCASYIAVASSSSPLLHRIP